MKSPRSISLPHYFAAVMTLAVAWLVTPLPVLAQNYQTIDPPGSTYTHAQHINDNGQIVGSYQDSNHTGHGFLYNNGKYSTIDLPGSVGTDATDINSLGQVVGTYEIAGGGPQGFLDSKGTYTTIERPGNINGYLYNNKAGQIVGTNRDNSVDHAFLYSAASGYTDLDFPGASDTYALSINDAGQVVGSYLYTDSNGIGQLTGFLYSHGTHTTIGPPGGIYTYLTSINKFGAIVGHYQQSSGGYEQGFVYSNGTYTPIEFPGAVSTVPISINDKGQITGYYQTSSTQNGFVFSNGQYTSIDPPAGIGATAFSINNSGQIVGDYEDNSTNHTNHGFLATVPKK
jgi:probable HAF family extracellular repeat protein